MDKISVAVLLSGREQFSVYYGGALARWTYEVYSRLQGQIEACVFGFPSDPETAYPLDHKSSNWCHACSLLSRVPILGRYEDELWLRALKPRLRRFTVIHIHNRPQWARLLRSLGYRGTVIVHLQNDHLGHWSRMMLDSLAPELDGLVVCSNYLRNQSIGDSVALASRTAVVFNGVNPKLFSSREGVREPKTIFFVGSLIPAKGPLQLLKAYELVLRSHPEARLVIGGSTTFGKQEKTEYVREICSMAVSIRTQYGASIEFPGYIHHDRDLPAFFQRATLFTSPSTFQEPFGIVNTEAMACATPVVGSNRGGIPEVLGETGVLVNPENTIEYAEALSSLLSDPDRRMKLGSAALERVRKFFDWNIIARTWLGYLQEVTGKKIVSLECA
ncbi:MAG TPA: glycosyltransferase family 4 protein [Candidatus Sulfotelmatobacter sp.]|nr:glycosyltransferase family 4 protein [Candidatus Sulfotelmatobacter sp.]